MSEVLVFTRRPVAVWIAASALSLATMDAVSGEASPGPEAYAFRATGDGFVAVNPAQGFGVGAADAGLWVSGGDRVLLSVTGFGWEGRVRPLPPAPPAASGARVEYRRGAVREWYENRPDGLEQGFTIERPPEEPAGEWLCLEIGVHTHLSACMDEARREVHFSDASGLARLCYGGLAARDAEGRALPVRLGLAHADGPGAAAVRLSVAARGAAYPVVVDPVLTSHAKYRQIAGADPGDGFGSAVAADGDLVAVAEYPTRGVVYMFERRMFGGGIPWSLVAEIRAADGLTNIQFGGAIALWGHTLAVAAPGGDAVYLYERNQGGINNWGGTQKIVYPDAAIDDEKNFGTAMALSGNILAIGMPTFGDARGRIYVYSRHAGGTNVWGLVRRLDPPAGYDGALVGDSLGVWGDTIVAGGPLADGPVVVSQRGECLVFRRHHAGTNDWGLVRALVAPTGQTNDHLGDTVAIWGDRMAAGGQAIARGSSGRAWLFRRDTWDMVAELAGNTSTAGHFGRRLAMRGNLLAAGAIHEGGGAAYVFERDVGGIGNWGRVARIADPDTTNSFRYGTVAQALETIVCGEDGYNGQRGAAFFYPLTAAAVTSAERLTPVDATNGALFGTSVAVAGDVLIVGAPDCRVGFNSFQGAAYVFRRTGDGDRRWERGPRILALDGDAYQRFGESVAADGDTVIVGAPQWDDGSTNIWRGAAYIFERDLGGTNAWGQAKRLLASDGAFMESFGDSVALDGGVAVVGRPNRAAGMVHLFERDWGGSDNWGEVTRLVQPAGNSNDLFGLSVAIDGGVIVVGTPGDDVLGVTDKGSAYVYERSDTWSGWGQVKKLVPTGDVSNIYFGRSVAVAGDTIVVGALYENSDGTVHVFERNFGGPANWGEVTNFTSPDAMHLDQFGGSVAIARDRIVVSAGGSAAAGGRPGAVEYVYARNPGNEITWELVARFSNSVPGASFQQVACVAANEDVIATGHPYDDAPGLNDDGAVSVYHAIHYPTPEIRATGLRGTASHVARWSSYEDIEYSLSSTTNLLTGPWTTNASVIATGTVTEATHAVPGAGGLFHRVLLGPAVR